MIICAILARNVTNRMSFRRAKKSAYVCRQSALFLPADLAVLCPQAPLRPRPHTWGRKHGALAAIFAALKTAALRLNLRTPNRHAALKTRALRLSLRTPKRKCRAEDRGATVKPAVPKPTCHAEDRGATFDSRTAPLHVPRCAAPFGGIASVK